MSRAINVGMSLAIFGIGFGGVSSGRAETPRDVTLKSLMESGRQNHPSLAKQPLLAKKLKVHKSELGRAYWPQLSLDARATWQSDVISVDIPIPGATISSPPKEQYGATLKLQQTIWDGGVIADKKRLAETSFDVENEKVNLEWYRVRERILQLYFAGIVQQELQDQAKILEGYLGTILEKVELSLAAGVATKRDVLLVKARRLEAQQVIIDTEAKLVSVKHSLEELSDASLSEGVKFLAPALKCANRDARKTTAADLKRPELSLLDAQAEVLIAQEALVRAADRPKVGAFATAGYGRPGLNALNDSLDSYFIGGIQLTVPLSHLYTGKSRKAKQQLALGQSIIARQQEAVLTQVQVQLDSQHAEVSRLIAAIALDAELLKIRAEAREQTELQLAGGTATMTDLVSDLSEEDRARSKNAIHRAQLDLACHQLAFIRGEL